MAVVALLGTGAVAVGAASAARAAPPVRPTPQVAPAPPLVARPEDEVDESPSFSSELLRSHPRVVDLYRALLASRLASTEGLGSQPRPGHAGHPSAGGRSRPTGRWRRRPGWSPSSGRCTPGTRVGGPA